MIDKQLLHSRIQEIEESISRLEQLRSFNKDEFLNNRDIKDIACYRLLIIIEASISICQHICAREIHQAPETYANCFSLLEEHNLIEPELSLKLQQMVRFRNMLVHIYWEIDYSLVFDFINERLKDVKDYVLQIIKKYLSWSLSWVTNDQVGLYRDGGIR